MQPILMELPGWGIKIHSYGVMILLALYGGLSEYGLESQA